MSRRRRRSLGGMGTGGGGAAPVPVFPPETILGSALTAWWTVQRPTTIIRNVSDVVSAWNSHVGGYVLTAEGDPTYSSRQFIDYNPGVFTDGIDDAFVMASVAGFPLGNSQGSVFVVCNRNNQANADHIVTYGSSSVTRGRRSLSIPLAGQRPQADEGVIGASYQILPFIQNSRVRLFHASWEASNTFRIYSDGNLDPTNGTKTSAYNTVDNNGMAVGKYFTNIEYGSFRYQDILIISGSITSGQRIQLESYFAETYRSTEWLPTSHPSYMLQQIAFEGDSISSGIATDTTPYPERAHKAINQIYTGMNNFAVPTSTIDSGANNVVARSATVDSYKTSSVRNIYSLFIGTNNWVPGDTDTSVFLGKVATHLDAKIAAGWDKIILCTLLPRAAPAQNVGFEPWRQDVNTVYRSWLGTRADVICDFGADSVMGLQAAASDTSLYLDGQHPTGLGKENLARVMTAAINAVSV